MYIAYKGLYQGRVIIPILENGHIIYFQGRAVVDIEPKYLNPVIEKTGVILNRMKFDKHKYIIITEGILDSLALGNQGTSCLGASVTDEFLEHVIPLTDKKVIIAMDNDEPGLTEMIRIIYESKYSSELKYFLMPYKYKEVKDLNKLSVDYDQLDIYKLVTENSYSKFDTLVKLKMEGKDENYRARKGLHNSKHSR